MANPRPLPLPPLKDLREQLELSRQSPSGLVWRVRKRRDVPKGSVAGFRKANGRWLVRFGKRQWMASRIVWAMLFDEDPWPMEVDHIDGNPSNNDWSNLRIASRRQNVRNSSSNGRYRRGVSRVSSGRFTAQINDDSKTRHLGTFDTEDEAAAAYERAACEIHGQFAYLHRANAALAKAEGREGKP